MSKNKAEIVEKQAVSIVAENEVEYYPIGPLIAEEPIQFDIPKSWTQLTDPNFLLKIRAKVVKADGSKLDKAARVAPVNLTLHALFRDIVLKVNNVIVSQATNTYPYRAYIETNFTYSSAAKNGAVGIPQMFYKEQSGMFNATVAGSNPAFDKRVAKFAESNVVEMAGRIHCDFLLQSKLIIPGVKFSLTLVPTPTSFHLLSGAATPSEKIIITKIMLKVRRMYISSSTILGIERSLQQKPALYPINRATVRSTQLAPAQTHLSNFVLNSGQIPRLIIITLVRSSSVLGSYAANPFLLSLRKCISAQIQVNGRLFPPLPYTPNESLIDPYLNSLRIVQKRYTDSDTGISFDDFLHEGHQILPFDLNPEEGGIPAKSNGVITFTGQWPATAFGDYCTLFFYMLWDNSISIDHHRNVILDYIP